MGVNAINFFFILVASLLSCLHQLRTENIRLEEHVNNLVTRRDHLLAVNARLAIPLNPNNNVQQSQVQFNNLHNINGPTDVAAAAAAIATRTGRTQQQQQQHYNIQQQQQPVVENGIDFRHQSGGNNNNVGSRFDE